MMAAEKRGITVKQRAFADYYIELGNAELAAKRAGYSARGNTSKLLQNTTISNYIEERMKELESEKIAKQDEILQYLTRVMRREERETQVVTLRYSESKWVDGKKVTEEGERAEVVEIPPRLSDSNRAAELLGKRYAIWTDRTEHSGEVVTIVDDLTDDDLDG
jgi:phage terminase small subunit